MGTLKIMGKSWLEFGKVFDTVWCIPDSTLGESSVHNLHETGGISSQRGTIFHKLASTF